MQMSSIRSVSSCSSYFCSSSPSSSTSHLFAGTSSSFLSPLGSLQYVSPEATSSVISRLVPKSALARKIQKARQLAELQVGESRRSSEATITVDESLMAKRERIQAKFLREEEQWKKDALLDADARIARYVKALGM